jgi:hypothetical protein
MKEAEMRRATLAIRGLSMALGAAMIVGCSSERAPSALDAQKPGADIWGVWIGLGGPDADPRFRNTPFPDPPDFTEWGAAESKRLATSTTPGECNPWSPVMFMRGSGLFPIQILQGPNLIVMHHEAITQPRRIYMDGRRHPAADDMLPTFLGHAIGHWEDDTLVVDTVGTNGRARPINGYISGSVNSGVDTAPRLPASEQLHVVERIRVVGGGQYLQDVITVEDPKTYRKPFTVTSYWQRRPDIDVQEYACEDNRRPDAEGQQVAGASLP